MRFTAESITLNPLGLATVGEGVLALYQPILTGTVNVGLGIEGRFEARLVNEEITDLAALVGRIVVRIEQQAKAGSLTEITREEGSDG